MCHGQTDWTDDKEAIPMYQCACFALTIYSIACFLFFLLTKWAFNNNNNYFHCQSLWKSSLLLLQNLGFLTTRVIEVFCFYQFPFLFL